MTLSLRLASSFHFLTAHRISSPSSKRLCFRLLIRSAVAMARLAIVLLLVVVAIAHHASGTNAVSCNTNGGSPLQSDGNTCVQYIRNLGDSQCCQGNCGGDFCTQMQASGGARVLICGPCNKCTKCSTAGSALNNVLAQCVRNVGGQARCSGNDNADGFAFVIDQTRRVQANATDEVIQMVSEE